jgi:hypothetical protein
VGRLYIKQSKAPPHPFKSVNLLHFKGAWLRITQSLDDITIRKGVTRSAALGLSTRAAVVKSSKGFPEQFETVAASYKLQATCIKKVILYQVVLFHLFRLQRLPQVYLFNQQCNGESAGKRIQDGVPETIGNTIDSCSSNRLRSTSARDSHTAGFHKGDLLPGPTALVQFAPSPASHGNST